MIIPNYLFILCTNIGETLKLFIALSTVKQPCLSENLRFLLKNDELQLKLLHGTGFHNISHAICIYMQTQGQDTTQKLQQQNTEKVKGNTNIWSVDLYQSLLYFSFRNHNAKHKTRMSQGVQLPGDGSAVYMWQTDCFFLLSPAAELPLPARCGTRPSWSLPRSRTRPSRSAGWSCILCLAQTFWRGKEQCKCTRTLKCIYSRDKQEHWG